MKRNLWIFAIISILLGAFLSRGELNGNDLSFRSRGIPILLYHRFGPAPVDSMTVTTAVFESQLKHLALNGYVVITLRELVDYYQGKKAAPSAKSVVITADDGHKSVYTDMFPVLKKYQIPATLFIYPSAVSNADYAVTWSELKEMKQSGLVDFQSHTFWHPNFKKEKERLKPSDYESFVDMQLKNSKRKLERELDLTVDMVAWPFGICNPELIHKALQSGYVASFTMERRHASLNDCVQSLPRYLITNFDKASFVTIRMSSAGG